MIMLDSRFYALFCDHSLHFSILLSTFSFPRISMILGTPTPDSEPAKADRNSCIIVARGCFKSCETCLTAIDILSKFHSLIALIFSAALVSIPSGEQSAADGWDFTE